MLRINRVVVATIFCLQAALSLLWTQPALALERLLPPTPARPSPSYRQKWPASGVLCASRTSTSNFF